MSGPHQHAELARQVLSNAQRYEWTLHGLGMLRFYLTPDLRLHVWDSRYRVKNVSGVHTHPWDLDSTVLCGRVQQHRFKREPDLNADTGDQRSRNFDEHTILCADGGHLEGESNPVTLTPQWDYVRTDGLEVIEAGDSYHQGAEEIHLSLPADGTVTLMRRTLSLIRSDRAFVYVPAGEEWVDAKVIHPSRDVIENIALSALERWFS